MAKLVDPKALAAHPAVAIGLLCGGPGKSPPAV